MQTTNTIESLEARKHLSSTPYLTSNGSLVVTGTSRDETIIIDNDASGRITAVVQWGKKIMGAAKFKPSQVKRVMVDAAGGNDQIILRAEGIRSAALKGGSGNDAIHAIGFGMSIEGEDGDDRISAFEPEFGTGAASSLFGGAGRDRLQAGRGTFLLEGGAGNDILFHASYAPTYDTAINTASKSLLVESVMNAFRSEYGEATLYGGAGNDLIYAASNDAVFGGSGRDHLMFDMQAPGLRRPQYQYDTDGLLAEQIGAYDIEVTQIAVF